MKRARDPDLIREAMAARDLTHREMACLAGCSYGTIGFILAGRRAVNPELARRIARVLRRPLSVLFADVDASDRQSVDDQEAVA